VLPGWLRTIAGFNPLTIAIRGLRSALLGGTGWTGVGTHVLELAPLSIAAMALGWFAFRLALARERRNGTLGMY
jgi:ABC-type multidrug transport system permease subunit